MTQLPGGQNYQPTSYFYWASSQEAAHVVGSSYDNLLLLCEERQTTRASAAPQASVTGHHGASQQQLSRQAASKPCRSEVDELFTGQPVEAPLPESRHLPQLSGPMGTKSLSRKDCEGFCSTSYYSHAVHYHVEAPLEDTRPLVAMY